MQFQYNSDYPVTAAIDPQEFPPAEPVPCLRIQTRVYYPTRNKVATVQNVLIRTINAATTTRSSSCIRNNNIACVSSGGDMTEGEVRNASTKMNMISGGDNSLSSNMSSSFSSSSSSDGSMLLDDDSNDGGDDTLLPQQYQNDANNEIKYAYWVQRTIREAIYGRVLFAVILRRRPRALVINNGAEWEVTSDHCAVKEMSWHHIKKERDRLAEDPIKEVSSMQYLHRWWKQLRQEQLMQQQQQQQLVRIHNDGNHVDVTQLLIAMKDTNIMMPLDLLSDDRNLYSIMPYCDGGELFERLDLNERFSENEARYWMDQILNGLENLQKLGICHRDMSLENLLVHNERALVIDMGMCLLVPFHEVDQAGLAISFNSMKIIGVEGNQHDYQHHQTNNNNNIVSENWNGRTRRRCLIRPQGTCGKWIYMSPEIYRNEKPFDGFAVDMWAAGVILFLMLTGFPPWERACQTDERFHYMTAGYLVQMLTEWGIPLTSDAMDLLQRMLFLDPKDRLSLDQVRAHPWMVYREGNRDF